MNLVRLFSLLLSLSLLVGISFAQIDLDESHNFANGLRIDYPSDWELSEDQDGVYLYSDLTEMFFLFAPFTSEENVEAELENLFSITRQDEAIEFVSDDIFFGGLANFSLTASYFYLDSVDGEDLQRALFAIPVEEAIIVKVAVSPVQSRSIDELSIVLRILSSLDYDEDRVTESPSTSNAGADAGEYRWASGVVMAYPEGFEVVEDGSTVHFVNDNLDIALSFYPVRDSRETNHASSIRLKFDEISTVDFDEESFVFVSLANDSQALAYRYEERSNGDNFEQVLVAFQPDALFIAVAVVLPRSTFSVDDVGGLEQVLQMLGTMRFG